MPDSTIRRFSLDDHVRRFLFPLILRCWLSRRRSGCWFLGEETKKGAIAPGQFADLAALSADYFSVAEEAIEQIESVLTVLDAKVVYRSGEFAKHAPPLLHVPPDLSPVKAYGGYHRLGAQAGRARERRTLPANRSRP